MWTAVGLLVCLALSVSDAAPSVRCTAQVNGDQHWSMDCSSLNVTNIKAGESIIKPVHNLTLSKNEIEDIKLANWTDLRYLDLSFNRIANLTDDDFCCSKHLVHLNISHNSLEVISPKAFRKLTSLRSLDLSWNPRLGGSQYNDWAGLKLPLSHHLGKLYMSSIGLEYIPADTFENARALRTLDVSHNSLKHLPVFPQTLVNLDLSYNLLEVVPAESFHRCEALEWLSFDNTRLSAIEDGAFHSLLRLAVVSLKGCKNLEMYREATFHEMGQMKDTTCELDPKFGSVVFRLDAIEIQADQLDCNRSMKWFAEPKPVSMPGNDGYDSGALVSQKMVKYALIIVSFVGLCSLLASLWVSCSIKKKRKAMNDRDEKDPLYESTHDLPPQHPNAIYVSTVTKK